jgi:drug/metabolite transporter (DMT)-like permease
MAQASSGEGTWSIGGDLLAASAMLLFCGWSLLARQMRSQHSISPFRLMAAATVVSFVVIGTIALLGDKPIVPDRRAFPFIVATALFGTSGHLLAVWTQRYLPVSLTSVLALGQVPLAAIIAALIFDEPILAGHVVGGVIVMGALAALVQSHAAEHQLPLFDEAEFDASAASTAAPS